MNSFSAKVMSCSPTVDSEVPPAGPLGSDRWWGDYSAAVHSLSHARDDSEAIDALRAAARTLGADGAVFCSAVRHDAALTIVRALVACDTDWINDYASADWFEDDPWLHYAAQSSLPIIASEIRPLGTRQLAMLDAVRSHGFASAVVVPAPSSGGTSRVGVLCIGSRLEGRFESSAFSALRPLACGLAMEVSEWCLRKTRAHLVVRAQLTSDDLEMLRQQARGCGTKEMARQMGIATTAVDTRIQRLNRRLGVAHRRDAIRLARLYGLL